MLIKEPKVELWLQDDPVAHVAKCARVCYGNKEGKSTDQQLYDNLLKAKHNSMFRHESVYAIIRNSEMIKLKDAFIALEIGSPYINIQHDAFNTYIVTNGNWMIDHKDSAVWQMIKEYQVSPVVFGGNIGKEPNHSMMRYTFHITTQISTSRELNRVSPNNIAERSTRYVDESDGVIVRPHWMQYAPMELYNDEGITYVGDSLTRNYLLACERSFDAYKELIANGRKRQDARGVLPLDTATEVIYTYSVQEWEHIIELRSSKQAHPNCRIIANMIKEQLEQLDYDL